jgi:hypothetical protein
MRLCSVRQNYGTRSRSAAPAGKTFLSRQSRAIRYLELLENILYRVPKSFDHYRFVWLKGSFPFSPFVVEEFFD